jgi:hypothetical protein
MPLPAERDGLPRSLLVGAAAALPILGYGLTLWTFYPGIMTYDAKFVYDDIGKGTLGDWQSPVMVWLWGVIDPIAFGAGSMFLLTATLYWLGFALPSFALAARGRRGALLLPILALMPPALAFVGIIWRDVLLAACWLLASGIGFAVTERSPRIRLPAQLFALALVAIGVLLRPNALLAAPILAAYLIWPSQFSLRRTAVLFVPAVLGFFAIVQLVYYGALGATRQHPLQSIMIFDLGGISHFAKENQYPVDWSAPQNEMLLNSCYQPIQWDIYWRLEPCSFVMGTIEREQHLFGTSAIPKAWLSAVLRHPLAYMQHRMDFMWNFLAADNLTMWLADVDHPMRQVLPGRKPFAALVSIHDALKGTPAFRVGSWLLACIVLCWFAWRRADTSGGAFVLGVCGSAVIYVLSFLFIGVASDFRYGYWAVLAAIVGAVMVISGERSGNAEWPAIVWPARGSQPVRMIPPSSCSQPPRRPAAS